MALKDWKKTVLNKYRIKFSNINPKSIWYGYYFSIVRLGSEGDWYIAPKRWTKDSDIKLFGRWFRLKSQALTFARNYMRKH